MASMGQGAGARNCVTILGVPIDQVSMDQALNRIENFIQEGGTHLVVTADANGIIIAQQDEGFRNLISQADLATPDGAGVLWAAKRKGSSIKERVSGVDIVEKVCALSAQKGYRIYFLGAEPGIAELAGQKLTEKYPGCNIVGTHHGYFKAEDELKIAQAIAAAQPDVLFVALGMPRQERFIQSTRPIIQAKVAVGVGGSFDVFSGKTKRAPKVMQAIHLEWMWRLLLNPSKFAKVKNLPKFAIKVLGDRS